MSSPTGPRLWDEFGWNEESTGLGDTTMKYPELLDEADLVNKPSHYNHGGIEAIVYMKDNMSTEAYLGYLEGCAKKYLHRFRYKGKAKEDLKKAQWYLNKLIEDID